MKLRVTKDLLLACLLFVVLNTAQAIPFFNITTTDKVLNLAVGTRATVTYTIQNFVDADIPNMQYIPPELTSLSSASTCSSSLPKGANCTVVLTVQAPKVPESGSVLLDPLRVCGLQRGLLCSVATRANRIRLNVIDATRGHFVFRNSNEEDITSLDLSPGATGTITLNNTGGSVISSTQALLTIPTAVSGYFAGSCTTVMSLAAGASCNLTYTIPSAPEVGFYNLVASGINADNSPDTLVVHIATQGHFVFRNGSKNITNLDLSPGTTGTITLNNTGSNTISNTQALLTIPAAISGYFEGSCTTVMSLAAGASCNLTYNIPSTPEVGFYNLVASGTDADNSPDTLVVHIATQGHFVFRNSGGKSITNLDLSPGTTGSITLNNTGGSTINSTQALLTIPAVISGYFAGSCTTVTSLAASASCNLTYNIPSTPEVGFYNLVASGTDADNSPDTLVVHIATQGHFIFRNSGGKSITNLDVSPGATRTITLNNTGDGAISSAQALLIIPAAINSYFSGNCTTVTSLAAGASCNLTYNIPPTPAVGTYNLVAEGDNADNSPDTLVVHIAAQGHFVFRNSGGKSITNLDVSPGATGSITLSNTGGSTINSTQVLLTIPAAISGYFEGSCTTVMSLAAGASCNLTYNIPSTPQVGPYNLVAEGTNADNSPDTLVVHISTQGHFVFRNSGGKNITNLDVSAGTTGSITLNNTGGSTISNTQALLTIPAAVSGYFAGSCTTVMSLAAGASCNLTYNIPSTPQVGPYNLVASGINADNSPDTLVVHIATQGHFVFRNSGGKNITNLDVSPGTTGYITLNNTGGSTINSTQALLTIPAAISGYFGGSCTTVMSLAAGVSCNLTYNIPSTPQVGPYNLVAEGTNADNSPDTLVVHIATQGHFVFRNSGGKNITDLDVSPGTTGSITLNNTGDSTISNTQALLTIPAAISGYFGGSCTTVMSLAAGASCNLTYTIPSSPAVGEYNLVAEGVDADNSPANLAFRIASHVFVIDAGKSTVSYCFVNATDGTLSDDCTDTGAKALNEPADIVLNTNSTRAYITNRGDNRVILCNVSAASNFSDCINAGGAGLNQPVGLALNSAGTIIFVVSQNKIRRCNINADTGLLSSCADAGTFNQPVNLAFNAAGTRVYVTELVLRTVVRCDVDVATGAFSNCSNTGATGLLNPTDIAINNNGTHAYITTGNNIVFRCDVDPATGTFSNCGATGGSYQFGFSQGIVLNPMGTRAYIAGGLSRVVNFCNINPSTGELSGCGNTIGNGFDVPTGLYYK